MDSPPHHPGNAVTNAGALCDPGYHHWRLRDDGRAQKRRFALYRARDNGVSGKDQANA
ncbi:MAG: hypothetical protein ACLPPF_22795 [Rhodomicrobium sp.]